MQRSESIVELVKALAAAQPEMEPPKKSKTAKLGTYSYQYADLAAVRDAYKGPLAKRGLIVAHSIAPVDGHLLLTTTLMHTSGEWIASDYPIPVYEKPQEQGSALTYFKRYNVCALLDVVAEDDDDGATAQAAAPKQREDEAPPSSGDVSVIIDLAAELSQINGRTPGDIIREASAFKGRDGKDKSFTDPRTVTSAKWLKGVRETLERALHKAGAMDAVGAEPVPF